ncbi:arabinan endo-1,5-alpha-L-arabinosidase [Luteimonas suaedae]|uniref:arabinan endo-1,5-alpha-L-arabinosidase n=1 Tax=Luteimonas suaedae TaxID=2605430 RepID=UPI001CA84345|nr:arabinan endo-1,5-alpha-L-arabinosidase [Luteimonas suaedae]
MATIHSTTRRRRLHAMLLSCMALAPWAAAAQAPEHPSSMLHDPPVAQQREGYWADVLAHDPVMIREGDTWYLFVTGPGISVYSSPDMKKWKAEPPVFPQIPAWAYDVVPDFNGHVWAPDISYHDGVYSLYYSISSGGKNTSAIGVATSTTLDPGDPAFGWVDHGILIRSVPGRDLWNAIDANLVEDDDGTPWLSFGSFWSGLKLVRLGADRRSIAQPQEWHTIARRERPFDADDRTAAPAALEAPFIFRKDGWYYLFLSWDSCCRGVDSTYRIMVGRSRDVRGPYLDREGRRLDQGGGTQVLAGTPRWPGPGHNSAYTFDGKDYLVFHAYDTEDGGRPKLKIAELGWDADGWPIADAAVLEP